MSNGINLASLGFGGIDTSTLVSSLVALEQKPVNAMVTRQRNVQSASATLSNFSTTLGALANAATALSDPTIFAAMKATSSDASVVTSATGAATAGQWTVSVAAIAQQQRTRSAGQTSTTTALGLSGTLGISLGNGTSANVTVSATDTLSDLAAAIGAAGLRIQAGSTYDGSQYHLLVSGLDTGASNAIVFDESGLEGTDSTLGLSAPSSTIQAAQDASLTVGGQVVSSPTNQLTNAIPGVTLALTQPTTTPAVIRIAGDSTGLQSQVQAFVNAYNAVVSAGHAAAGFGTAAAQNSLLQGDVSIQSALHQLALVASQRMGGSSATYTTLASVGMRLKDDGTLAFDSNKFGAAVEADPTSVTKLFASDPNHPSTGLMSAVNGAISVIADPHTGRIHGSISVFAARNTALTAQITSAQQRVTAHETDLQKKFAQMNTLLQHYKQVNSALTQAFNQNDTNNNKAW